MSATPIPFAAAGTGADATIGNAGDPSVHLRPTFVPTQPPAVRTALTSQWNANKRVFANPNGTYDLQLGENFNYKDGSGQWHAIDLSLVDNGSGHFHPTAAPSALDLNASSGDTGIASLAGSDGTIGLRTLGYGAGGRFGAGLKFVGTNGKPDVFVNPTDTGFEFGATFGGPNIGPGVNLVLDPGSLVPSLETDGRTIDFKLADGTLVGTVSPPTLTDANEIAADPSMVTVSLVARGDGTYLLGYTVNAAWMHTQGRQFPVTLDPTACIRASGGTSCTYNSSGNTSDIWYGSGQPSSYVTSSTTSYIHVGYYRATSDPWAQTRGAVFFDPSSINLPDGSVITGATLNLREANNYSSTTTPKIQAHLIKKSTGWAINTSSATWNSLASAIDSSAYDSPSYSPCSTGATDCDLNLDVTKAVWAWFNRTPSLWRPNVGFQLRYVTEGTSSSYYETAFYRYNNSTATNRPELDISYEAGGYQIDFDPALGSTYAPSSMVASQTTVLPVTVKNIGGVNFDGTHWALGYRFMDVKGTVVGSGTGPMPAVNTGATSGVFGVSITPPSTPGRYTLRLDVAHTGLAFGGTGVAYYSDWGLPTLFYARNKKVLTTDSTRWVGSSKMERDEFSINVTNGQGGSSDPKNVTFGSNGTASIDLYSHNLSFDGDTGLSVSDRIPLAMIYGYNSKDAGCSGYQGLLGACGWFTNFDERVTAGSSNGDYTYTDPLGNDYLTDSDWDGQLVGAPVQLTRQNVTMFDENRPTSGGTLVTTMNEATPFAAASGTQAVRVLDNTTTVLGGFVDGAAGREISLNSFRFLRASMRTSAATNKIEVCFQLDDKTTGAQPWFCAEPGTDWDTGHDRTWWNNTNMNTNWANISFDLWGVASGVVGNFGVGGGKNDDYYLKSVEIIGDASNPANQYIYLDALRLEERSTFNWRNGGHPTWDGGATTTTVYDDSLGGAGANLTSGSVSCTGTCFSNSIFTDGMNGSSWPIMQTLTASPFMSWWWKKTGGSTASLTVNLTDTRTNATGQVTYYAGPTPPVGAPNPIQVSPLAPATMTRVIRNVLEDGRQVLNWYKDADVGHDSASPPTDGPTPDTVQMTGYVFDRVDGSNLVFEDFGMDSIGEDFNASLSYRTNRFGVDDNEDLLNYSFPTSSGHSVADDFRAEYPDGSTHYFNRDGVLTRITTKDGMEEDFDYTYSSGSGQANYILTKVHAPSDNTVNGGVTYHHSLTFTWTDAAHISPSQAIKQLTVTENLGSGSGTTGRSAAFEIATAVQSSGVVWGVSDLVKVSTARHPESALPAAACALHASPWTPSGCVEFEYTTTTSHLLERVADPRWDGQTTGGNNYRFEVTWTPYGSAPGCFAAEVSCPTAISDDSRAGTPALMRILSFDRGRTGAQTGNSPYRLRPLWQDAAAIGAMYAQHEDLTPDGSVAATYVRQACPTASLPADCLSSAHWPAGDNSVLGTNSTILASSHGFDGANNVSSTTTYRCPGVSNGGCTGTTALLSVARQGSNAAAKVENWSDVLAAGQVAWKQSGDQYFASLRDSGGTNPDLYRTTYVYDGVGNVISASQPVFDRVTDYAGAIKSTDGLAGYWPLSDTGGSPWTMADSSGNNHSGSYFGSPTQGDPGPVARDAASKAVTLSGTGQYGKVTGTSFSAGLTGDFSFDVWANASTNASSLSLVGTRAPVDYGFNLKLCNDSTCAGGKQIRVKIGDGTQWLLQANAPFDWQPGRWYYIAAAVTSSSNTVRIYVDGQKIAAFPFQLNGTAVLANASHDLYFGNNGQNGDMFSGSLADAAVYANGVDESAIEAHYLAGRGIAIARTETTYADGGYSKRHGVEAVQSATQLVHNSSFEEGNAGWNAAHGFGVCYGDTGSCAYQGSGAVALQLTGSNWTEQDIQALPGQRLHFQLGAAVLAAPAQATYEVDYERTSDSSWQPILGPASVTSTSGTTSAYEFTVPLANSTGRVRVKLSNGGGAGTAGFDDVLLVAVWRQFHYLTPANFSGGSAKAYVQDGLPDKTTSASPAADGSNRLDQTLYAADSAHQAVFPTATIQNYIDGVPGPAADQDMTSTTTYDAWGRVLKSTDPDGVFASRLYDPTNLTDLVQTSDNFTNPPLVPPTTMTYDVAGNLTATLTPQGRLTSTTYDLLNRKVSTTAPDGTTAKTDYDDYGRVSDTWANYIAGIPLNDQDVLTTYAYDEYGRVTRKDVECGQLACTTGLDARTVTTYDLLGSTVASTAYPGAAGTGTARVTTNYFETWSVATGATCPSDSTKHDCTYSRTEASGISLPIAPSSTPAPVCPGTTSTRCNSASVWQWGGGTASGVDMNGRVFGATDAYGIVTVTDSDFSGHPVQAIANYWTGADDGLNDQNVTTKIEYNSGGAPILTTKVVAPPSGVRYDTNSFDALGRQLTLIHYGTDGVSFGSATNTYTPGGRLATVNDGASTTKTVYDAAGRAVRTIVNYDAAGNAGMTIDAFESGTDGWSKASSGFFTTGAAFSMGLSEDGQQNEWSTVPPVSGRGRLGVTTDATNTADGVWLDLTPSASPATYQAGHTYKVAFDVVGGQNGTALRAFFGQDSSGGSYAELSGGITTTTSWQRKSFSWTPSSSASSGVHFAVRKDTAGSADFYLDNVVVWDATTGWADKGILSSETAYDLDGRTIGSVLPPGDPAVDEPLVTTMAIDVGGRTLETTVNGASGTYAAAIMGSPGLVSYFPLDDQYGTQPLDQHVGTQLTNTGGVTLGVAGGIDEARTAARFSGGYLSENANATSAVGTIAMEAWVRADAAPGGANTVIVASNGDTSNSWGLGITPSGEAAGFAQKATSPNSGFWTMAATGIVVTDGAWHHLVLSRDSTTWSLTVDGTSKTITNSTKDPGTPGPRFTIGAWSDGSRAFSGDVDEVSVYTSNIGTSGALAHYQAGHQTDTVTAATTRTNYDRLGRPTDTWASDGIRTKTSYDRLGNRTDTWTDYKDGLTSSTTGDDDVHATFANDVLGDLVGYCPAVQVKAGGCDPAAGSNSQAWHYTFDAMGRQVTSKPPDNQTAADLDMTETVYEAGGRVAMTCSYPAYPTQGSCTGTTSTRHTDLTYDGLGRTLTSKVYDRSTGSDVLKFTKTTTWNVDSTMASVAESGDTLTYAYDPAGRVSAIKRGATTLTSYAYNAATGTLASRTDGTIGTSTFGYDWARRNTSITPPAAFGGTITRTFRADGSLATQAFPNGVTEALSYDPAKRPIRVDMGTTGYLTQTNDRAGRVLTEGRSFTGITGDAGNGLQSFTYDGLSRVTGSTGLSASHAYTYDLDGNRVSKTDAGTVTTYSYDRTDELVSQQVGAGSPTSFVYDAFGNMTTSVDVAATTTTSYAYDEANRLKTITPSSGSPATFTLDALGRAMTRTVGTSTDTYGYLGDTETAYETGAGTTDAIYDAAGARLAVKTGSSLSYVIFDLHGSVAALSPSGSTSISDAYRYDPWGQVISSGTATNPWRYRGLLDVSPNATPLFDMGARYYSPQLGTFTAEDSVVGKAADPLSMNRFLYAEADPTTLIDPDGHNTCPLAAATTVAVGWEPIGGTEVAAVADASCVVTAGAEAVTGVLVWLGIIKIGTDAIVPAITQAKPVSKVDDWNDQVRRTLPQGGPETGGPGGESGNLCKTTACYFKVFLAMMLVFSNLVAGITPGESDEPDLPPTNGSHPRVGPGTTPVTWQQIWKDIQQIFNPSAKKTPTAPSPAPAVQPSPTTTTTRRVTYSPRGIYAI